MSTSSPPSDIRNPRRGEKRKLALIIGLSIAAGLGLALSPPEIKNLGSAVISVVLTTLGAVGAGMSALIYGRSGRLLLCVLCGIMSICLALLALPAWSRLFSAALPA